MSLEILGSRTVYEISVESELKLSRKRAEQREFQRKRLRIHDREKQRERDSRRLRLGEMHTEAFLIAKRPDINDTDSQTEISIIRD